MQILIYVLVFLFFAVVVLGSTAINHMGETRGIKLHWLGFVPIIQFYVIGKLIETIDFPNFQIPKAEFILPVLPFVFSAAYFFPIPDILILIFMFILAIIWLYAWNTFFLLFTYHQKKAAIFTFLGGILVFPLYIILFLIRNNKRLDEIK